MFFVFNFNLWKRSLIQWKPRYVKTVLHYVQEKAKNVYLLGYSAKETLHFDLYVLCTLVFFLGVQNKILLAPYGDRSNLRKYSIVGILTKTSSSVFSTYLA